MAALLSNRTRSYLKVRHRISCSVEKAADLTKLLSDGLKEKEDEKSLLGEGKRREASDGIPVEEDQAADQVQKAVVQL